MDYELRKACERGECAQALQLIKSSGWRDEFAVLGPDEAVFDRAVRWRDGEYDGWRSPDDPILTTRGEPPVPKWCLWLPLVQLFDDAGAPLPRGAWKVRWSDGTEIETPRSDVRICHTAHARLNTEGLPATPLILACAAAGLPVVIKGRFALARALLDAGHAVDVKTPSGTALVPHPNSFRSIPSPAMMELLLDHGADIEQMNSRGKTALCLAAEGNAAQHVRLLLARGAAVDRPTPSGVTPLMMACERGAADRDVRAVVLHLLYRGADENRTYIGPYRSDRALVPRNITVKEMARQSWRTYGSPKRLSGAEPPLPAGYRGHQAHHIIFGATNPLQLARRRVLKYWLPRLRHEVIGPRRTGASARFAFYYNRDVLRHLVAFLG